MTATGDRIAAALLADAIPKMRPNELEFFHAQVSTLPDDTHILEFGMGGSTVLMASTLRPAQHLYSVEHDPDWFKKIQAVVGAQPNVHLHLRKNVLTYVITICEMEGLPLDTDTSKLRAKVEMSKFLPEECTAGLSGYLDMSYGNDWSKTRLVLVDGVVRGTCLAMLRHYLPAGAKVLLHDYHFIQDDTPEDVDVPRRDWYDFGVRLYTPGWSVGSFLVLTVPEGKP